MTSKIRKILITGSSGTIGTRLFEKLLEKGYEAIGFDRKRNKWHSHLDALTIKGDLLKKNDINKLPNDFDLIIHLAANARVYDLVIYPDLALDNIVSTYNILSFAKRNIVKKFIFSSSREAYSNRNKIIAKEEDVNLQLCESPYAASKVSGEALVYSFSKCYDIDYMVLRFSNVYGMYDESNRLIPLLLRTMVKNENVDIFGKDKVLDFTYIDDCIDGTIKCVEKFHTAKNNVFNIASGSGEKLIDVAENIKKELMSKSKIFIKKSRPGEVVKFVADISKAKKILNYQPQYSIQEGLHLSINWYRNLWKPL